MKDLDYYKNTMNKVYEILEEIKEHQMQTVQLARTTKVYKLAEKAQAEQLNLSGVVGSLITLDEVGNKFKVIANTSGHDFYVGETVTLLGITEDEEDEYKFQVKKDHWWCGFADVKRL